MKRTKRIVNYLEKVKTNLITDGLWNQYRDIFEPMIDNLGTDGAISKAALFYLLNTIEQTSVSPRKKFVDILHEKNFSTIADSNLNLIPLSIIIPYHGVPQSDRFFQSFDLENVLGNIHKELYTFLPKSSYQRNVQMSIGDDSEIKTDAIVEWQADRVNKGQSKTENLRDFKRGVKINGRQFYSENDEVIKAAIDSLITHAPKKDQPALQQFMQTAADQGMDRFMAMEQLTLCRANIGQHAEFISPVAASGDINWYVKQDGRDSVICCDIEQTHHIITANNRNYRLNPSSGHLMEISFDDMQAEKISHPVSHSKATIKLTLVKDGEDTIVVPKVVKYQQQYYCRDIVLADSNNNAIEHSSEYPIQSGVALVHERLQTDTQYRPPR